MGDRELGSRIEFDLGDLEKIYKLGQQHMRERVLEEHVRPSAQWLRGRIERMELRGIRFNLCDALEGDW